MQINTIVVGDLQKYSCVSWRTLDRAFKEKFGIGPKKYSVAVRLAAARKALRTAKGQTVTDIATDCGFTHMGRFSHSYSQMFDELPSETRLGSTSSRT